METESRHLAVFIARSPSAVYEYIANPGNLRNWAAGLGDSVRWDGGQWVADSPIGRISIEFAAPNKLGVVDHWVTLPGGHRSYNPMRVIPVDDGCEVVFTLRPQPGQNQHALEADSVTVSSDLATLKRLLESSGNSG